MGEGVADIAGQRGARGDQRQLLFEPWFQSFDDGRGKFLAGRQARIRGVASHVGLDGVERGDVADRGLSDRRFGVAQQLDETPPQMAPAMDQRPWTFVPLYSRDTNLR